MRSALLVSSVGLVLGAGVLAAGCQQPSSAALSPQDVAAIQAVPGTWTKAQLAGDWATFEAMFTDSVAFFPPNMAPVEGKAAAMSFLKGFPTLTDFTATAVDVSGSGTLAYERGAFSYTTAATPNAPSATDKGTYLAILRRQADGSWKVTGDIWHSDLPVPAPAPAPAKKK